MTASPVEHRFYGELAGWWPLISPPEEYGEEAEFAAGLLDPGPGRMAGAGDSQPSVLELGSGGGHLASHLADRFSLTLVDLSEPMLEVSRRLNPTASHHQGDMRSVRLGRQFDAVSIHDAVDYMTSEADLAAAIATAYEHCRPGGRVVIVPDEVAETFEPHTDHGGTDADDGRAVRFLEWSWDPDPADTWTPDRVHLRASLRPRLGRGGARVAPIRSVQPGHLAPGCSPMPAWSPVPTLRSRPPATNPASGSSVAA